MWSFALACLGVLIVAGGFVIGFLALRFPSPPNAAVPEVGLALTIDGRHVGGLDERVYAVTGGGCSGPVRVAVLLAANTALWSRYPATRADLRDAVTGPSASRHSTLARLGIAITAAGIRQPYAYEGSTAELLGGLNVVPTGSDRPFNALFEPTAFMRESIYDEGNFWVGSVTLPAWPATHIPVVVTFATNWNLGRSPGSCYVTLPALLGDGTHNATIAAETGIGEPLEVAHVAAGDTGPAAFNPVQAARVVIEAPGGVIDSASSTPAPNLLDSENKVGWECSVPPSPRGTANSEPVLTKSTATWAPFSLSQRPWPGCLSVGASTAPHSP